LLSGFITIVGGVHIISRKKLWGHHPHLVYLQPKKHHIYGCGVCHIRVKV
jgi:hypothetical protein